MELIVPLFAFLGALITALGGWMIYKRKTGGTVATSEASEIWTANRELREMLMNEASTRTKENLALRAEVEERRKENERCHAAELEMKKRIDELEVNARDLQQEVADLVRELTNRGER